MTTTRRYAAALAVVGICTLAGPVGTSEAAGAPDGLSASPDVFGAAHAPVPDSRLAEMRGGTLTLPDGIVSIGVSVVGDIDGQALEDAINFTFNKRIGDPEATFKVNDDVIDDGAFRDENVRVAVDGDGAGSVQTVVQTGSGILQGRAISPSAGGLLTAVQNNLDNIDIDVTNTVDIRTNGELGGTGISQAMSRVSDGTGF